MFRIPYCIQHQNGMRSDYVMPFDSDIELGPEEIVEVFTPIESTLSFKRAGESLLVQFSSNQSLKINKFFENCIQMRFMQFNVNIHKLKSMLNDATELQSDVVKNIDNLSSAPPAQATSKAPESKESPMTAADAIQWEQDDDVMEHTPVDHERGKVFKYPLVLNPALSAGESLTGTIDGHSLNELSWANIVILPDGKQQLKIKFPDDYKNQKPSVQIFVKHGEDFTSILILDINIGLGANAFSDRNM